MKSRTYVLHDLMAINRNGHKIVTLDWEAQEPPLVVPVDAHQRLKVNRIPRDKKTGELKPALEGKRRNYVKDLPTTKDIKLPKLPPASTLPPSSSLRSILKVTSAYEQGDDHP